MLRHPNGRFNYLWNELTASAFHSSVRMPPTSQRSLDPIFVVHIAPSILESKLTIRGALLLRTATIVVQRYRIFVLSVWEANS